MPDMVVTGERAGLGPLRLDLCERYSAWVNDLDVRFSLGMRQISTPESTRRFVEEQIAAGAKDPPECAMFTVYDLSDEEPVGVAGLKSVNWFARKADLVMHLGQRRGQGLGGETVELVLDWAFTALGLGNVMLEVFEFNEAGRRAYLRAGFREIGRRRASVMSMGRRWDAVLMDAIPADRPERAGTIGTWTAPHEPTPTTSSASRPEPPARS